MKDVNNTLTFNPYYTQMNGLMMTPFAQGNFGVAPANPNTLNKDVYTPQNAVPEENTAVNKDGDKFVKNDNQKPKSQTYKMEDFKNDIRSKQN